MKNKLMRGVLFLLMTAMSVCTFSQRNSPQWIQSPSGDTLLGFNSQHVDILGEKLILKSYLIQRNYELVQLNTFCTERCNALAEALDERKEEVAALDDQIRKTEMRILALNAAIEEKEALIKKLNRRLKVQKVVTYVAIIFATTTTALYLEQK